MLSLILSSVYRSKISYLRYLEFITVFGMHLIINLAQITKDLSTLPAQRLLIAFSGGMDSMVLLHIFYILKQDKLINQPIIALHANHNLQPNSNAWQQFCGDWCQARNIPYITETLSLDTNQPSKPNINIEATARKARYAFFSQHMQSGDYLCTAHHQDDQLETLLLRLARGAGLTGLTAIARTTPFAGGYLHRPLLDYSRKQIEHYAKAQELQWIEDPSNQQTDFDRNYLRHQVIPALKQRWPSIAASSVKTTDLLAKNQQVIDEYTSELLGKIQNTFNGLNINALKQLNPATRNLVLRSWLKASNHAYPTRIKLKEIAKQMLGARSDANPIVRYGSTEIRRYKNFIYCFKTKYGFKTKAFKKERLLTNYFWQGQESIILPGSTLYFTKTYGKGLSYDKVRPDQNSGLSIGWRQTSVNCKPQGRRTKSLKKWLQEYQVPPWLRYKIPLVCCNDELIAVADLFICESWQAKNNAWGLTLHWQID